MRINDIVTAAFNGAAAKLRRDAMLWAACAFCAVAAIVMATSASILALEPHVGVVYARLIVAGVYAVILLALVIGLRMARPARMPRPAIAVDAHIETSARNTQFAQLAMIVEAVMLGYSLSRRSDRR